MHKQSCKFSCNCDYSVIIIAMVVAMTALMISKTTPFMQCLWYLLQQWLQQQLCQLVATITLVAIKNIVNIVTGLNLHSQDKDFTHLIFTATVIATDCHNDCGIISAICCSNDHTIISQNVWDTKNYKHGQRLTQNWKWFLTAGETSQIHGCTLFDFEFEWMRAYKASK